MRRTGWTAGNKETWEKRLRASGLQEENVYVSETLAVVLSSLAQRLVVFCFGKIIN